MKARKPLGVSGFFCVAMHEEAVSLMNNVGYGIICVTDTESKEYEAYEENGHER